MSSNLTTEECSTDWLLSAYDFTLPPELIAQAPAAQRDHSRMMKIPLTGEPWSHHSFYELIDLLPQSICLVLNNTKVLPARLLGNRQTGAAIEALLVEEIKTAQWTAMIKKAGRIKVGECLQFGSTLKAVAHERMEDGTWLLEFENPERFQEELQQEGLPPLPPYIQRKDVSETQQDRERYQTCFASQTGAIAAPTAGLHFTPEMLQQLRDKGITILEITLHVGRGTFVPISTEDIRSHQMHSEFFSVTDETYEQLQKCQKDGKKIISVGTTVVRVLETLAQSNFASLQGWTDIYIYPP